MVDETLTAYRNVHIVQEMQNTTLRVVNYCDEKQVGIKDGGHKTKGCGTCNKQFAWS